MACCVCSRPRTGRLRRVERGCGACIVDTRQCCSCSLERAAPSSRPHLLLPDGLVSRQDRPSAHSASFRCFSLCFQRGLPALRLGANPHTAFLKPQTGCSAPKRLNAPPKRPIYPPTGSRKSLSRPLAWTLSPRRTRPRPERPLWDPERGRKEREKRS